MVMACVLNYSRRVSSDSKRLIVRLKLISLRLARFIVYHFTCKLLLEIYRIEDA